MAATDAPTRELGRTDTLTLTPWAADVIEHVPDLRYPNSVTTYAKMRHDPTLRSILSAYTLPIRTAPWHVDPRGASPAIARVVADSLGLPLLGDDPEAAGAAATHGVRWDDHLRMALLSLAFGHMPFEPVYEIRGDGLAYVAALPERMPHSLLIETTDRGDLLGITQELGTATPPTVTIPADRLLFYSHDREGAAWWGTSMLRPAFGPWLFKQDAIRGQATSLRRFGAGTPVAEPLPGFNPTPAQITEAQRLVSSIRVGDTGGAVPVGFTLRIKGIEGAVPDHMPFLRYLDEQMARAALTSVFDLGSTENGSRALGSVFKELLLTALQAIAEEHAVAASVLARRLTDFNEGEGAAAPVIVVGDVGTSQEAMAQTVATLVQAGALTLDPALEGYVREAFDLPPRDPSAPVAVPAPGGGSGLSNGTKPTPAQPDPPPPLPPITAAATAAGVATLRSDWPYRRQPSAIEVKAALDPVGLDVDLATLVQSFLNAWPGLSAGQHDQIVAAVEAAVASGDLTQLATGVGADSGPLAEALLALLDDAYAVGVDSASGEADAQGIGLGDVPPAPTGRHSQVATVAAASMIASLASGAVREALRLAGKDTPAADVAAGVRDYLTGLSSAFPRDIAAGLASDGINGGRVAAFDAAPVEPTYYASEIRDANTCGPCADIDGQAFGSLEEAEAAYPSGGYGDCDGGMRCRGVIVAVWPDGSGSGEGE